MEYLDIMVDLETTGTTPEHSAIIQIAAVKFDLATKSISNEMFDRRLWMPLSRYWDEGTRDWWLRTAPHVLQDILNTAEDPAIVLNDFRKWVGIGSADPVRLWAKPSHFEYPFLESYFRSHGIDNPFHYRYVNDMNSYIRGRGIDPVALAKMVPFQGDAHNALHDVINQIAVLFEAHK